VISIEGSIPRHSDGGLSVRDLFYIQFNTVNFYVEDEDQENLYHELIRRLFPSLKVEQVFALRGKRNVIKHAQDPANASNAHRSVYILDKDFDDLLGRVVRQENIFYLRQFCIENYLLEEDATVQVAVESLPRREREALRGELRIRAFMSSSIRAAEPLFRLFLTVQRFDLGMQNTDLKPERFAKHGRNWEIDEGAVADYGTEVYSRLRRLAVFKDDVEIKEFISKSIPRTSPRHVNISGKFLLALLFHHLRHCRVISNVTLDSLTYRLARNCVTTGLQSLGTKIRRFLRRGAVDV
jgi:Protein of unknown function (DUF4435)